MYDHVHCSDCTAGELLTLQPTDVTISRTVRNSYFYSAKKLKLRQVLQTLCGAFERCSRVRL